MFCKNGFCYFLLFFLLLGFATCSISDGVFDVHGSTGRSLLQTKKSCPVNFEFLNYTVITSQCKGPKYPTNECCGAFKEFACPYAEQLNDLTNDCATTMFSYINLYGRYPPGLFADICREGKEGLACPANSTALTSAKSTVEENSGHMVSASMQILMLATGFVGFLFHLL